MFNTATNINQNSLQIARCTIFLSAENYEMASRHASFSNHTVEDGHEKWLWLL